MKWNYGLLQLESLNSISEGGYYCHEPKIEEKSE